MHGSLNEILPEPISAENEQVIRELLKRKMKGAAGVAVRLLHAMVDRFGSEAREVVREIAEKHQVKPNPDAGDPAEDLHKFCAGLDKACVGSHQWERVIDQPERIGYRYTSCMWADVFRELGEPELGFVICAGDEPAVKSCNPGLGFERTQLLMNGDDICDHVFFVEK